jgi:hypothetical protein
VIIEDRLAARVAQPLDQLADPLTGQLWIIAKQPMDLVPDGSSFDGLGAKR